MVFILSCSILYTIIFIGSLFPIALFKTYKIHSFHIYFIAIHIYLLIIFKSHFYFKKKYYLNLYQKKNIIFISIIIAIGIILRFFCLFAEPFTTDLYRYLSDGLNLLKGNNPYYAKTIGDNVSYPELTTIYPIITEIIFFISTYLWQDIHIFKYTFGFIEFLFLLWVYKYFIFKYKKHNNQYILKSPFLFVLFTLNPTLIYECYKEGHSEIASIFIFIIAATLLHTNRKYKSSKLAIISFFTKLHGILLFPIYIQGKINFRTLCKWAFIVLLGLLPFIIGILYNTKSGFVKYVNYWYFNHFPTFILKYFFHNTSIIVKVLQCCLLSLLIFFTICLLLKKYNSRQYLSVCIFTILVFMPTQHPWYFLIGFYCILFNFQYRLLWSLLISCSEISYLNYLNYNWIFTSLYPWIFGLIGFYVQRKEKCNSP